MVALWHQGRLEECADLVHFWHHWTAKGWGILQPVALHGVKCNYWPSQDHIGHPQIQLVIIIFSIVSVYLTIYVCMYVFMHVCVYVCTYVRMDGWMYVCMCVCVYVFM